MSARQRLRHRVRHCRVRQDHLTEAQSKRPSSQMPPQSARPHAGADAPMIITASGGAEVSRIGGHAPQRRIHMAKGTVAEAWRRPAIRSKISADCFLLNR